MDHFDQFDQPGQPTAVSISDMKLPPVIAKWMSPWGNSEFVRMVRSHGHTQYNIDAIGLSSISAACSDALYDEYSVHDIENTIANVAKSIAEDHLDAIELRRERNEYRAQLKMPPLPLPVEREIERNPGMTENTLNNHALDAPFWCSQCGDGYDDYNGCDGCDSSECPECNTGFDSPDDCYESYDP
jgi:hypothetical protein